MPSTAFVLLHVGLLAAPVWAQAGAEQVNKVVQLLEGMKKAIEEDGEKDKDAYDKYMCWCDNTIAELEGSIDGGKKYIVKLTALLEENAGLMAELKVKIENLETKEEPSDVDAKKTAEEQRAEEAAAFAKEEKDLKDCIAALKEAIAVLSKVQLIQQRGESTAHMESEVRPALLQLQHLAKKEGSPFAKFRAVMQKDLYDALSSLNDERKTKASAFLTREASQLPWETTDEEKGMAAKPNELEGAAAGAKSYNSQSGQILGILKAQFDEMVKDLARAHKTELEAIIAFHRLRDAKGDEIKTDHKLIDDYEMKLSLTIDSSSQAKVDMEATKKTLSEDEKTLAETKDMCKQAEEEYKARVAARGEEIRAIAETIKILTSDEAREQFGKTVTFLQVDKVASSTALQQRAMRAAVELVLSVATKHKDMALASAMVRTRLDAFTKVKKMMDDMLAELKAQQKAEEEKMEFCKKEIDSTEDEIKQGKWDLEDLQEKKLELENAIEKLKDEIVSLKDEIGALEQSLKKAGEDRKAENLVFKQAVADQRITAQILKKALARLEMQYGAKFMQVGTHKGFAPPPPKPGAYQSKGLEAGGPMGLLTEIIKNAEQEEAKLIADEQDAQTSYGKFAQDATDTIEADRAAVLEKTELQSKTEGALSETEEAILEKETSLTKLAELLTNLHADCDYVMKYFEVRQEARAEEMDSIEQAKAILSGA